MKIIDRIIHLRTAVAREQAWIESHGGNLAGYRKRYGDKGVAPIGDNGEPMVFVIPRDMPELAEGLVPAIGQPEGTYYRPMFGAGGKAIYEADTAKLNALKQELADAEARYEMVLINRPQPKPAAKKGFSIKQVEEFLRQLILDAEVIRGRLADPDETNISVANMFLEKTAEKARAILNDQPRL